MRTDCCPCIGDANGRDPCLRKMRVDYSWNSPCADLDTCTEYDNATAGWSCDNGGNPQFVSGDDTGCGGTESIEIEINDKGYTQYVTLSARWYKGRRTDDEGNCYDDCCDTSCPITITVKFCNGESGTEEIKAKTVSTNDTNTSCASGNVLATVEIYSDGTWDLV
jgi:hypothetical protein